MKKPIIFLIVVVLLVLCLMGLNKLLEEDDSDYIVTYLEREGYSLDEEDAYYHKVISDTTMDEYFTAISNDEDSEYEELYFNNSLYTYSKVKMSYVDNVSTNFSISYNLVDEVISYKYELAIYSSSIILGGEYDKESEEFTCQVSSSVEMDEDNIDTYCARAEYETILFLEQATDFLSDTRFSSIIDEGVVTE